MRKDILFKDGDLDIRDGDFNIGVSDEQHIAHIFEAMPGSYKQSPFVGIGIRLYINSSLNGVLRRQVKLQLEGDGYAGAIIKNEGEKISINI